MTRFPSPVVSPAAAPHQHRFEAGPSPPSGFHPQPVVAASIQGAASGQGGGNQDGDQVGNQGGGNQARHDEALRQNALHRQMLAEVEERHREATLQVKWRILLQKMSNWKWRILLKKSKCQIGKAVGQRDFYIGAGIGVGVGATRIPGSSPLIVCYP